MGLIVEFHKEGKLWDDFLQKLSLPLNTFIAASRRGKWKTSQSCMVEFLLFLFATNQNVYTRNLPVIGFAYVDEPHAINSRY